MAIRRVKYVTAKADTSRGAGGSDALARARRERWNERYARRINGQTARTKAPLTHRAANLAAKALFWFVVGGLLYGLVVGLTH